MPLSSLAPEDDSLTISWLLAVPAQTVWAGFRDPALLSQWLGRPLVCDAKPGGRIVVDHGGGCLSRSVVTEADEPRRLAMTWDFPDEPDSQIAFALHPAESGTRMELVHNGLGSLVDSYGPGWVTHLTYLEAAVGGTPLPWSQFWPLHTSFEMLYGAADATAAAAPSR